MAYLIILAACAGAPRAPLGMKLVPAGPYVAGSTADERERAYADHERTSGSDVARRRRWFEAEEERHTAQLAAFWLDVTPVTNAEYARFLRATGRAAPAMDEETWRRQGYVQRWPDQVVRYVWPDRAAPPPGRERHPVVLVSWDDAVAYCRWRGARLPTAAELEKAARGAEGREYPWGAGWDPARLNSSDGGPADTVAVGSFPAGAGPYGHLDLAGNVFQWTSTPWRRAGEMTVKGSAWDDHAGVGRGASRHGRPRGVRHVIVGFRCAKSAR